MANKIKPKSQNASASRTSRITKSQALKFLAPVPEANAFWCNDGKLFRDIRELSEALGAMSDQTFAYHSNDVKKDFSNWIRDVVGDEKLAQTLESIRDREQANRIVEERYTLLAKKAY